MSLTNCIECGHEISTTAVACPNCGHPVVKPEPTIQKRVVVADATREESFPKWVIAPIIILGVVVIFLLIAIARSDNEDANSRNVNVKIASSSRQSSEKRDSVPNEVSVPSTSTEVPSTSTQTETAPPPVTKIPSSETQIETTGKVSIEAKVMTKNGKIETVKAEKFYLLDKSLESILREAGLKPINGQSLLNSFGLSVLYPDKYGDFNEDALDAINDHIKYDTLTDNSGKGAMSNVKPDSYYLFGITKTANGFAIWSSPVTIKNGENKLNLSPARLTEFSD